MKLAHIYTARDAWQRLAGLKLPAPTAYSLLKYLKQVMAESDVIEQQRVKLIRDIAGAKENENASLEPGTPGFLKFAEEFTKVLDTDSDLKPVDMKLEILLAEIGKEAGNALSAQDLGQLEPFFGAQEPNPIP
jgi:hypothetical protein